MTTVEKELVKEFVKAKGDKQDKQRQRQHIVDSKQFELVEIAKKHPSAERKGLDKTNRVKLNWKKDALVAVLEDGTEESFSVKKCLDGNPGSHLLNDIYHAFRNEVDSQIQDYREKNGLKRRSDIHVGHTGEHEFQSLFKSFCELKKLKIGKDLTENSILRRKDFRGKKTNFNLTYLKDQKLAEDWRKYHANNANLKSQSATENLTQKKQKVDMSNVIDPEISEIMKKNKKVTFTRG